MFNNQSCLRNSRIIDRDQIVEFMNLCEFPEGQKFQLRYRASEHGFSSDDFHAKCDGIKNTLSIIKSANNNIFGGYTGAAWNCSNYYIYDTNSFIFSWMNKSNDPFKANCTVNKHSIVGNESNGPIFGGACDFLISSDSNTNQDSCSNFGHTYNHGTYDNTILAGSRNFQTTEIEVYEKLN